MSVLFFLKQVDLISQKPTLLINNSERIKSVYGACLTMLFVALTIVFGVYYLYELFERENPNILVHEELDVEDAVVELNYETFPMFFSVMSEGKNVNYNKYFTMEIILRNLTKNEGYEDFQLDFSTCSYEKQLAHYKYNLESDFQPENFECLNFVNGSKINPMLKTRNNNLIENTFIKFSLKPCMDPANEKCTIPDNDLLQEISESNVYFTCGYLDRKLDFKNSSRPASVLRIPKYFTQKMSMDVVYSWEYNIIRETYTTDFGYLFLDTESHDLLTLDKITSITGDQREKSNNYIIPELLTFKLKINDVYKKVYKRTFYKGQNFFAEFGGVFNFLYVCAYHLNLIYSVVNFYLTIDNNVKLSYFSEKEVDAVRKSINVSSAHRASLYRPSNLVVNKEDRSPNNVHINHHKVESTGENFLPLNGLLNAAGLNLIKHSPNVRSPQRQSEFVNRDVLNLNHIGFRKLYSLDVIDSVINDFKGKVRSMNHKSISTPLGMIFRIVCCDRVSKQRRVYSRTVKKIREYLDVNNLIKTLMEFQNLKSILFSKNMLEVFKCFSDLKTLKEDKVVDIHLHLRHIYETNNQPDSEQNNNLFVGEEKVKDMDHYAAQYFIENFMKK